MASTDLCKGRLRVGIKRNNQNEGTGAFLITLSDERRQVTCVRLSFNEAARLWRQLDNMLPDHWEFTRFLSAGG